ncbi:MAG: hypothetical protein IJM12_04615, partial [Bacteroidales bacterium]|nr:hypothetical protein [Bacteroidales bacterium]
FAGMKCLHHILVLGLLIAVMVRCGSSPDSPALTGTTSQSGTAALEALKEIDSLMWKQPDSALTVTLKFAASPEADSLDEFEGHYCQMLISELLYKNDYEQSNREELLKAVDYFDSIVAADGYKPDSRKDAPRASAKNVQNIAFLDARVHYINGVGYYEQNDMVQACSEYLNSLELMEEHFEERELVEHKARFLAYTYNRLGDLFSEQLMMESAITCYENSLVYCKISPTSPVGISNTLYHIGRQYDKKNDVENANLYYGQALENLAATDNMVYRNIVASKAVCDYEIQGDVKQVLDKLNYTLIHSKTEKERLHRYMAIGGIFFYEGIYDSALFYLEPVFEDNEAGLQALAAGYLRIIYDSIGNREQSNVYMRFLTNHKKPEGEIKALVSKLEELFKDYMDKKQKKEAEAEREGAIKKTIKIIVPIAVVVVLAIIIFAKLKSKKLLKEQQEEADRKFGVTEQEHENELRRLQAEAEQRLTDAERKHQQKVKEMAKRHEDELKLQKDKSEQEIARTRKRHEEELEAERSAYQKEREELERSLQQSKENVSALQEELGRKRTGAAEHYAAFLEEPVCIKINGLVRDLHITTRKPYSHYHISLDNETIAQLSEAVTAHYGELKPTLQCLYPGISHEDLLLCYLYLLGLSNKQIAVLRQRDYSTVRKQAKELMGKLRIDETVRDYVLDVAGVEEFVEE